MFVEQLSSAGFRNLEGQVVRLDPRVNVLWGQNAQGKTNFLEAVHVLLSLSAFRTQRSADLIRFSEREAGVRGVVRTTTGSREVAVRVRAGQKQARVDGKVVGSPRAYLEGLSVVLFCPEDLQVPRGSPGLRRRVLDRSVAGVWPGYVGLLRDYQRVLASRNRLLKTPGGADRGLLRVYTAQLARLGAGVVAGRRRYLAGLGPLFSEAYRRVSGGGARAELAYRSDPALEGVEPVVGALTEALSERLHGTAGEDLRRGSTSVGPHTDDLDILLDGRSTRSVGSQGQLRTAVLALRMAQISDGYRVLGFYPVLLLDDVSSELDRERRGYLFDFIKEIECQTVVTTTDAGVIPGRENRKDFQVVKGRVVEVVGG